MQNKKKTIVQQACEEVAGLEELLLRLRKKKVITGAGEKTIEIYMRQTAKIALFYKLLPSALTVEQIEEYLYEIKIKAPANSYNDFQFTIFALKDVFIIENKTDIGYLLPRIKRPIKIPVILNRQEVVLMINQPIYFKHRLIISLLYGCGLRCSELRNLRIADIDLVTKMLYVRNGKNNKDRKIPLGKELASIVKTYIDTYRPMEWLFAGRSAAGMDVEQYRKISTRSILWLVKQAAAGARIKKNITAHTLRHCFATHLLEDGLDIISLKEMLGHANIETTMNYLKSVDSWRKSVFNPMDSLMGLNVVRGVQFKLDFGDN